MKHLFRKRMIAGAIATLLAAPAWTATVTADEAAKVRSGAQSGSELRSDTGSSSRTGTSQSDTALGSGMSTTVQSSGASTSGTAGTDTSKSGTAYGSGSSTTSGSASTGTTGTADTSTSKAGTAYSSGTGTSSGSAGASTSAAGTDSARSMSAGTSKADNPLYSRTVGELVGSEIVDVTGDDIGEIDKIVLTQDRRGAHAVVSVGGFLGIGEHDIVVSLDELKPAEDGKWRLNATKEQLEARPHYDSKQYVDLDGDQPISGSITDFAAFETDRNRTTGTSRDSDATSRMDKSMDKDNMRQPSTESGAAGASRDMSGSATTGGSTTTK